MASMLVTHAALTLQDVLAQEGHAGRELPVEPWAYGLGAFGLLVVLLLVTLSFGKDR